MGLLETREKYSRAPGLSHFKRSRATAFSQGVSSSLLALNGQEVYAVEITAARHSLQL